MNGLLLPLQMINRHGYGGLRVVGAPDGSRAATGRTERA